MALQTYSRRSVLRAASTMAAATLVAACTPRGTVQAPSADEPIAQVEVDDVSGTRAPSVKGRILILTPPYTDDDLTLLFGPINEGFHEIHPDIDITIDLVTWNDRREKLYTSFAAGAPPDIFHADSDTVEAYGMKGVALPLQDLVDAELLSDYDPVNVELGTYEGNLIILANLQKCAGPSHNSKLMEECGFDPVQGVATWDEILALGEAAKSKGYYVDSVATDGSTGWQQWLLWLRSANGTVYSEDRLSVTLREQPAIDALNMYKTLYDQGYIPPEGIGGDRGTHFEEQRQVTLFRAGEDGCVAIPKQFPGFPFAESRPRQQTSAHRPISGYGAMRGWSITSSSKNVEPALEWVKYNIRPDIIAQFCTIAIEIPTGHQARSMWVAEPCVMDHVEAHKDYLWFNQDSYTFWQESKVYCQPHFEAAVLGTETVEEALDLAAQELEQLIAER